MAQERAYAERFGVKYGAAAISIEEPQGAGGITEKALLVLSGLHDLDAVLRRIEAKVHPPAPAGEGKLPATDPEHITFVLEESHRRIGSLHKRLQEVLSAL